MDKVLKQVVLASNNLGKIKEFTDILKNFNIALLPQSDFNVPALAETGVTFVENAMLKARHAAQFTHLPALADDSGLTVPALAGAPGIYSARYAGLEAQAKDNIQKLLKNMENMPDKKRQAYFYCVLVLITSANDPIPLICDGRWSGSILPAPQGNEGFGYDPIFYVPTEKKSAAALSPALKNQISHRAIALHTLMKRLPEKLNECTLC